MLERTVAKSYGCPTSKKEEAGNGGINSHFRMERRSLRKKKKLGLNGGMNKFPLPVLDTDDLIESMENRAIKDFLPLMVKLILEI